MRWPKCRLKHVASINDEVLSKTTDPDWELEYVDISNVSNKGRIAGIQRYSFERAPSRARRIVRDGDIIVSTVRTYLKAVARIKDPPDNMIVSTGFAVVRPGQDLDHNFASYALQSEDFIEQVVAESQGISYPAITSERLGCIPVSLPPREKQPAIADYLDRETARIDELVAEKEKMLALLEEKRNALITRAVTRGLDPKATMKDSGVAWLGGFPNTWTQERAKVLFSVRDERSEDGTEELLTVSHLTGVTPRAGKDVFMFKAESQEGYKKCYPGDFVVNTLWAWMGAMGIVREPGIVSPDYHVYVTGPRYLPDYFDYLCRSGPFVAEVNRHSKGVWSSRLRLYPEVFFNIRLPVPPPEEQRAIVEALNTELSEARELETALKQSINLLTERRTALITAAVTGQIDVVGAN